MKRFKLILAATVAATLLLSACNIVVVPGPPPADYSREANSTPGTPVWNGSLAAGQSLAFKLTVPSDVRNGNDLVYIELDKNLDLELRNPSNYNVVASSGGPRYYAPGTGGLIFSSEELGSQAITAAPACRGSCVLIPTSGSSTYYARVVNKGGSAVSFNLYFFGDAEMDEGENNDSIATATFFDIASASGDTGAIELMYDKDYWRVSASGSVEFITAVDNPVDLRLEVLNGNGTRVLGPVGNGDTVSVITGDYLYVYSASNRGGAAATSQYTLLGGL